jgi:hypothetical protein
MHIELQIYSGICETLFKKGVKRIISSSGKRLFMKKSGVKVLVPLSHSDIWQIIIKTSLQADMEKVSTELVWCA